MGRLHRNSQIIQFQMPASFSFPEFIYFLLLHLHSFMFLLPNTFTFKVKRCLYCANITRSSNSLPVVEVWTPYRADQTKSIHIHMSYMFTNVFNIIFLTISSSPKRNFPFPIGFPSKILLSSFLFYACYTLIFSSSFSSSSCFDQSKCCESQHGFKYCIFVKSIQ